MALILNKLGSDPDGFRAFGRTSPARFCWVRVQERVPWSQATMRPSHLIFQFTLTTDANAFLAKTFAFREQCQDFAQVRIPSLSIFAWKDNPITTTAHKDVFTSFSIFFSGLAGPHSEQLWAGGFCFPIFVEKFSRSLIFKGFAQPRPKWPDLSARGENAPEQVDKREKLDFQKVFVLSKTPKCNWHFPGSSSVLMPNLDKVWPWEVCRAPQCSDVVDNSKSSGWSLQSSMVRRSSWLTPMSSSSLHPYGILKQIHMVSSN